jgi:hypothetical protein
LFTLLLHIHLLYIKLLSNVIIRLFIRARYNSLANKVKRIQAITDTLIGSVKVIYVSNYSDYSIVISGVIKYKVT